MLTMFPGCVLEELLAVPSPDGAGQPGAPGVLVLLTDPGTDGRTLRILQETATDVGLQASR